MNKNRAVIGLALLFSVIVGSILFFRHAPQQYAGPRPFPPGVISAQNEPKTYSWHFEDGPFSETDRTPTVSVMLSLDDKTYDVGTYGGECFEIGNSANPLRPEERIAVQCWSANGGDRISVLLDKGKLIVAHTQLSKQDPDYREDFTPLFEI